MKFVEKKEIKEPEGLVTMDVYEDEFVVNVDGCNVFILHADGKFTVWKKHGLCELTSGTINDLEE